MKILKLLPKRAPLIARVSFPRIVDTFSLPKEFFDIWYKSENANTFICYAIGEEHFDKFLKSNLPTSLFCGSGQFPNEEEALSLMLRWISLQFSPNSTRHVGVHVRYLTISKTQIKKSLKMWKESI